MGAGYGRNSQFLASLAARLQPVFVPIDPGRDRPEVLRDYVRGFDEYILPLPGTAEQLARAAASFGVVFHKVPGSGADDYTFAPSAQMSLIGPEGGLVTRFSTDVNSDRLAAAWWAAERARRRPFALPVRNDPSPTDRLAGRDLDGNTHAPSISSAAGCRAAVRGGSISSWRCAFKGPTSRPSLSKVGCGARRAVPGGKAEWPRTVEPSILEARAGRSGSRREAVHTAPSRNRGSDTAATQRRSESA